MTFSEFKKMINEIDESMYGNRKVILEATTSYNVAEVTELNLHKFYDKGLGKILDELDPAFEVFDVEEIIRCIVIRG
jgi:hypothetical protein